ncbi:hypothetical protein PQO03_16990 [Lentisphaera profundi]|uniref:HTH cro/C1-type domain-containing protein n=1 Tax=Lentisphaera profundi TaxID=1658616 RepID=A0ABY7VWF2_9BACT|nr:hypothetical protein [Lentisphaera profundi]WDE97525.1 hypothetical protein PQO03_16990 [Lentisphaera profundi]
MPKGQPITRDINVTHPEKWISDEIGRYANKELLGQFGMKVRNLRNTMGSLMLRSGYSLEQLAAVLGNSPEVVRSNYARLVSDEVIVNLKEIKKN